MLDDKQEMLLRELLLEVREINLTLRLIREDIKGMSKTMSSVTMELIDPRKYVDEADGLPEFLPARDALIQAGISAVEDIPRTAKGLRAIDGIGWDEATMILHSLSKEEK